MKKQLTIYELLRQHPKNNDAILSFQPITKKNSSLLTKNKITSLSYGDLRKNIKQTIIDLNNFGIGRNDKIAIVLPNGPEMATAFLSIACAATAAPLNPSYTLDEFEFYLSDLNAKALVVMENSKSLAIQAAIHKNIVILNLSIKTSLMNGSFNLIPSGNTLLKDKNKKIGIAKENNTALVLHTSGTTSKPKIVPLSHANLYASAHNIKKTLQLNHNDVCLNIMPLFHIHGLIAPLLSTFASGGSVVTTPGFNALKFFKWLSQTKPTWYSAVPSMHQSILSRAARNKDIINNSQLKFIRSSSSSLSPSVFEELEKNFKTPVIEAYAMTEASHQMTSNQLPPKKRKAGTVGCPAGPDVAIMDETKPELLKHGNKGEIVIKGLNVTAGYENNPKANLDCFVNGWFRTGDQGFFDKDNYLIITGRLKEIINKGGEKISPREIDDVIMNHTSVQQVLTFSIPHKILGEDIAVAIVLHEGKKMEEKEIKSYVANRLAKFKIPKKIIFLDEIPKGATGKLKRIGFSEILGIDA